MNTFWQHWRGWWRRFPLILIAVPAFVSIWAGWVSLGGMAGFGLVHPLPGIADDFTINSAITLPIGVEAYSAYALGTWLTGRPMPRNARLFAAWSSGIALLLGLVGQVVYHVLTTTGHDKAPTPVVVFVACLPVLVLGAGATLHHLLGDPTDELGQAPADEMLTEPTPEPAPVMPEADRPAKPRRANARKGRKPAPRRLEADYLAEARSALTPGIEPTGAWCQQITGCGKTMSFRLAKALQAEREATAHVAQVADLPIHNTQEEAA